jgi:hypothetical protein
MITLVKDGPADFIKKLKVLDYIVKDSCAALGGMKLITKEVHGKKVIMSIEDRIKYLQENKIAIPTYPLFSSSLPSPYYNFN